MSDRQVLAEFGAGLCLMGLAPWAAPFVVPIAVLGAVLLDMRGKSDRQLAEKATAAALKALTDSADLNDTDIRTTGAWLKHRRAELRLDPVVLAAAAKTDRLPDALYGLIIDDSLAKDGGARAALRLALTAAYQVCRKQDDYHKIFTQEVLIGLSRDHGLFFERLDRIIDDQTAMRARMDQMAQMQAKLLTQFQAIQPQAFANHGLMIIGLAERYARNPDGTPITDFDSAYRGLENALQVAEAMRTQNALPHNAADQVDAVLARVQALNEAAEFDRAAEALAQAREEARARIAEQTSGLIRLLDQTVAQATLQNRPDMAAEALVERLLLDAPPDPFNALSALQDEWFARGRDKGLAFDLLVSIALAQASQTHARTQDQRGAAMHDLGSALEILGIREVGTARLEEALSAYTKALQECARNRVPLDWAQTQRDIGDVLQELGEREVSPAWMRAALATYKAALEEFTRDRVPLDWARTQCALGRTLYCLGVLETGTALLEQAVAAHSEALEELTRTRFPRDWAHTQANLGNTLLKLGEREAGTAWLRAAIAAYTAALQEGTRDEVPLSWASIQVNLTAVEIALFDKTSEPARLDAAREYISAAREVFLAAGAEYYIRWADNFIAEIELRV